MLSLPVSYYLALSAILFVIGLAGVLLRRNAIVMFMCIEIMLNAVNLSFISLAYAYGDYTGQIWAFMVIAVAAAEAGIGLAIILNLFRHHRTVNVDEVRLLNS